MGARIRAFDWAGTALGPISEWPPTLRMAVQLALDSPLPTVVAWGAELTCLYNDAYGPLLGAKPDALGRSFLDIWPEAAEVIQPLLDRALAGEATIHEAARFVLRRHGAPEEAWFDYSFSPLRDEEGRIVGVLNQGVEITQRVLAEQARLQSERRLEEALDAARLSSDFCALFEAAPTPLLAVAPPDWTIVAANDARLKVTGTTREATIGRRLFDAFPDDPDDPAADGVRMLSASLQRVLDTKAADTMAVQRYAIQDGDGRFQERWWSPVNTPVLGKNGAVALVIHRVEDVTDIMLMQGERSASDQLARDQQSVIDQLRSTEAARRTSEARYEQIVEGAEDFAIVSLDRRGIISGWNSGAERMTGYGRGEAVGAPGAIFFTPEDRLRGAPDHEMARAQTDGRAVDERWHLRKDGTRFWGSGLMMRLEGPDGGFLKIFRDRTAEHEAESALRASEARYRALFDSIESGFCVIEVGFAASDSCIDLRIVEANPAFERHSGLVGAQGRWLRTYTPELEEHWYEIYSRIARTGVPERFEEGSAALGRWFDVYAFRIDDPCERHVAVLFHDMSERRNAEERLRQLNVTLEGLVAERSAELDRTWRLSQDLFGIADAGGYFFRTNPSWQRVLGWTAEEIATTPFLDLIHPDDREKTLDALKGLDAGVPAFHFENRYRCRDGSYKWLSWSATPEEGRYYCVARDVTADKVRAAELEAAQEALRQSQKMEAMGQLTGGVAHDFNNLLTPIVGSLDLLKRRSLGGEREQRLIAGAIQSAERAKVLVQRLLAFARRQPLQPVPVDMGKLVADMAELVASTTGPQIQVVVETPDDLPAAKVDPNQVEMALLNLAVNARDAMPDGGTLRISAQAEVLSGEHDGLQPGGYVRLSVADTGIGMDEATLGRAVEPFYSTKGVGKGTGLGLSMVHGLASQLGGMLRISSRPGLGTNVELWLPQTDAEPGLSDPTSKAKEPPPRRGTALLVDDEELVRLSTAAMLSDLGYHVVEAASAEEALRVIRKGEPLDLIVTDHLMPGMTGADLARAVRAEQPELPVLLISGYAESEGIESGLPRLTKPFREDELAASLAQL